MASVTVWRFDTAEAADDAARALEDLARDGLLDLADAATATWAVEAATPRTRQLTEPEGGSACGAFWGLFFGLVFYVPLLGAAVGAASGTLPGALADVGIDDTFINRVRDQVTPGTSALFIVASEALVDTVKDALAGRGHELLSTHLTREQEGALRQVFGS